jgi:hypothetical protein
MEQKSAASIWKNGWSPGSPKTQASPGSSEVRPAQTTPPREGTTAQDRPSIWRHGWSPWETKAQEAGDSTEEVPPEKPAPEGEAQQKKTKAKASLPSRPKPKTLQDTGIPEIFMADLILKHCFYLNFFTLGDLTARLKLSTTVITPVVDYLRQEKFLEMRGPDPLKPASNALGISNRYGLTDGGKKRAAQLLEYDAYVGPAPVSLEDYWGQVQRQKIGQGEVTRARLEAAFEGLVLPSNLVAKLGPALVSGKPLFLYGPPGNGKTTLAMRMGKIWDDVILTPYALYVEGNVIRVFDEISHRPLPINNDGNGNSDHDLRWVPCYRPIVIVGGELTLDMLDLAYNPTLKYYNAPLQLKANSGLFIVDDLGRQQMKPQELLNRWIIPLENKQDYLTLHTGQKFVIPFDQFLIFATNLEPRTLMDEAFLRRIRSKVKVDHVEREQFLEIFRLVCHSHQIEFSEPMVRYLVTQYYGDDQRAMNACHPRDLVEQILDYCSFNERPPVLSKEHLDHACQVYFVE